MGAFIGCMVISVVLGLHGLDLLKVLKQIWRELEKLNKKQEVALPVQGIDFTALLAGACEDRMTGLQEFTSSGEASDDVLSHIDACKDCQAAVERVMTRLAKGFEELARHLKKNDDA